MQNTHLCFICLFLLACAPKQQDSVSQPSSLSSEPLPITGTWEIESHQGYYYSSPGKREKVVLEANQSDLSSWVFQTQISATGVGTAKSILNCNPTLEKRDEYFGIKSSPAFSPFPAYIRVNKCPNSNKKEFEREYRFLSLGQKRIPAHIGIDEQPNSIVKICEKLRGLRYVFIQDPQQNRSWGSHGCIGFSDPLANKLTLVAIPHQEAHAVQYTFKRK